MAHAFLSASSAHRWALCHAAPWREANVPDVTSAFAEEGTEAHGWLETFLTHGSCAAPKGKETMFAEVQKVVDKLTAMASGDRIYSEQKLDISFITGEEGACGTSDAVIVHANEIHVDDLKYGMGVAVDAVDNVQLLIYGAAALREFDLVGDIKTLRMSISQPRINNDSEWVLTVKEVEERIAVIRDIAKEVLKGEGKATPGEKQCKFCRVKGSCEEYRGHVLKTVAGEFVDFTKKVIPVKSVEASTSDSELATCMDALDMVEGWCKAVRAETERRLLDGSFTDSRYKLVQGKRGNRAWKDAEEAEKLMRTMCLKVDEMYDMKIISPTTAEKLLKAAHSRKWERLQEEITRSEGKPSVAPASDKRPALSMSVEFEAIQNEEFIEALAGLTIGSAK